MMKELDVDFKDTVVLDNDIYVLRRTMILPNISRIRVYGTRNTTIVWEGASDEDMFVVSGGFGHIFSGITFDGKGIARNVFMQKYDMFPALGSGKHMWDNCHFTRAKCGIQQGVNTLDYNCDLARIYNCHFTYMSGSAIKIVNNQSVANSIIDGRFVNCDTVFDLESGSLKCDGAVIHSCHTLLRMKGQGPGNCRIDLRGLHIDNIQKEGFKLVNHANPTRSKYMITLDGILGPRLTSSTTLANIKFDGTKLFGYNGDE